MKWVGIIAFCIFFNACKKDSKSENYPLKATMSTSSGKSFSANFLEIETKFSKSAALQGDVIILSGINKEGEYSLTLAIFKPRVGTFDVSVGTGSNCNARIPYFAPCCNSYNSSQLSGSGIITVESLTDTTIKGRFSAVCIGTNDTLRITNGSFNGQLH